jgi:hypothetical protein
LVSVGFSQLLLAYPVRRTTKITGPAKPAPVHHLVGRMSVSLLHCVSFMPFDKYFSAITVFSISLKRL